MADLGSFPIQMLRGFAAKRSRTDEFVQMPIDTLHKWRLVASQN
jgi:hypothetical protein